MGLSTGLLWFLQRNSKLRWARQQALPEINRLLQANEISTAFALAIEAERYLPDDPALTSLWPRIAVKTTIETTPAGAEVSIKEYVKPDSEWRRLGTAPLKDLRLPNAVFRWQIRKEGYEPVEQAAPPGAARSFSMLKVGEIPPGMVSVRGGTTHAASTGFASVQLEDYFIDRHEVTNRQFKEFIDRGGYANGSYWKQPFVKEGRTLTAAEAMAGFIDATGKPGPATWANGTYPEGQADHPVTGVSWFEAAAYAEFVGKQLPTIYHWRSAVLVATYTSIVPVSNFSRKALARVGSYQGMSQCGTFDMAGNAKEWCWNEASPGDRYILGGAWSEPEYMFSDSDAQSQFTRSPLNGFRCMKPLAGAPLAGSLLQPLVRKTRDYANEKPVSDEEFRIYRELFSYDKAPLNTRIEAVDDSDPRWRREKVSFAAPYAGNGRMLAVVFLPKGFPPPYQPVIFFPGADARTDRAPSSDKLVTLYRVEAIIRGGRAVIYPIYWGTYERGTEQPASPAITSNAYREYVVHQAKDFRRAIDYLETRNDLQSDKLAFVGQSWGASLGVVLTALENRIKVNIFVIGGFSQQRPPAQVDQINFAPRITTPTLMLNGNADFGFPLETSQRPMFRFLGTPPEQKRHVLFDSSHAVPIEPCTKEMNDWLDKYLGPAKRTGADAVAP